MKHSEMHKLMDDILKEVVVTRDSGQREYAHDDDNVFANFNRVAHLLEIDRKKVLMTYMLKHVDGIAAFVKGHKSQREDVRGRITDCIVYLMLLWGMIEEDGSIIDKQNNQNVCDVLKAIKADSISVDRRLRPSNGIQPKSNLQKVRQKRSRIKKSEKVGRTK